jgi:hypothetical protein
MGSGVHVHSFFLKDWFSHSKADLGRGRYKDRQHKQTFIFSKQGKNNNSPYQASAQKDDLLNLSN